MKFILLIVVCALLAGWLKKRGVRRSGDSILGGVCAGLANHFGWDVKVTRIVSFALVLFTGVPLVFYIIACIVLPKE
jgi:phage shock protein PspC (stress-responsive transcriptional regulator)